MFTLVIVVTSIGSLNVTLTVVFVATPVARFAGCTLDTCGATASGVSVVNVDMNCDARGLLLASRTPVVTVTV